VINSIFSNSFKKSIGIFCLLFFIGGVAFAGDKSGNNADTDLSKKISVVADSLVSDPRENNAEFIGNVKVVQGETTITSDRLKIYFSKKTADTSGADEGSLEKIIATGNVKIKFDNRVAVSEKAVYITMDKILILTGPNASISDKDNSISGEKITLYRNEGKIKVEGGLKNRVKAVILPGNAGLN